MFFMSLNVKGDLKELKIKSNEEFVYDNELDNEISVLADICDIFQDTNKIELVICGFGEMWKVDCRYDLLTLMEQIVEILRNLRKDKFNFNLDFFEQGVERNLTFLENDKDVIIKCTSGLNWIPKPEKIVMSKEEIKKNFEEIYEKFIKISNTLCPNLINHKFLNEFRNIL